MQHLNWDKMSKEVVTDKFTRQIVHGEKVMVAKLWLFKDCVIPLHHHENEQVSLVFEGLLKFVVGDKEVMLGPGDVLVIPSNVPHTALALEDTIGIDVFSPIRQDWLDKTDDYLRK